MVDFRAKTQGKKNRTNIKHNGAPWKMTHMATRQGWIYNYIVAGGGVNRKHSQEQFLKEAPRNIFKDKPKTVLTTKLFNWALRTLTAESVVTETGRCFKPKHSFFLFFVLKPKTLWQEKNSTFFFKFNIAKYLLTMVH